MTRPPFRRISLFSIILNFIIRELSPTSPCIRNGKTRILLHSQNAECPHGDPNSLEYPLNALSGDLNSPAPHLNTSAGSAHYPAYFLPVKGRIPWGGLASTCLCKILPCLQARSKSKQVSPRSESDRGETPLAFCPPPSPDFWLPRAPWLRRIKKPAVLKF